MSPNFLAKSVRLRWFKSSPTWSQLPKTGMGRGPGGSLKRLPRSLETKIAKMMVKKREMRTFSRKRRSMTMNCGGRGLREEWNGVVEFYRECRLDLGLRQMGWEGLVKKSGGSETG